MAGEGAGTLGAGWAGEGLASGEGVFSPDGESRAAFGAASVSGDGGLKSLTYQSPAVASTAPSTAGANQTGRREEYGDDDIANA